MTTNHPERLDPALIRPGRVDLSQLIDDATPLQAKRLFLQFYGKGDEESSGWENIPEDELNRMSLTIQEILEQRMRDGRRVSMAALQGLFIRSTAKDAVQGLRTLFHEQRTP